MKNKISKYILFFSIFTFLAIFTFIVQNSYSKLIKPIEEVKKSSLTQPIDPNLDLEVINQIENREP